jgi:enoyl-CoA hydratase
VTLSLEFAFHCEDHETGEVTRLLSRRGDASASVDIEPLENPMNDLTQLKVSVIDHVATLTMNAPPVNALTRVLNEELTLALDRISETDEVRVVILTGEGKVFCAGADLKGRAEVIKGPGDLLAHSRRTRECFHAIRECAKPVIAAINGAALGSGMAMAASSDILIASETATLGLPEVDVGLLGGGRHAMRLFGHSRLRRMALTGLRVGGAELYRLGIVEACVAPDQLMPAALEIAATIASKSPVSTRMGKHTLNVIEDMSLRDGYRYEQDMTAIISKTEDAREAQLSFREKRKPIFSGR